MLLNLLQAAAPLHFKFLLATHNKQTSFSKKKISLIVIWIFVNQGHFDFNYQVKTLCRFHLLRCYLLFQIFCDNKWDCCSWLILNYKLSKKFLATHWRILATHKCVATPGLRNTVLTYYRQLVGYTRALHVSNSFSFFLGIFIASSLSLSFFLFLFVSAFFHYCYLSLYLCLYLYVFFISLSLSLFLYLYLSA